jgi:cyclopropane-fatty-acyl-phospholipid synthase
MLTFKQRAGDLLQKMGVSTGGKKPHDIVVHDDLVYTRIAFGGSRELGNTYVDGLWDCEELDSFFEKAVRERLQNQLPLWLDFVTRIRDRVINIQSVRRALEVGRRHYDLGNELYVAMLGSSMAYSSAYFRSGAASLDEAQYAKFEKICSTLALKPGMRVLEIGCGWGTFAKYASEKYGVQVVGISISKEQLAFAREHCSVNKNEFHFLDYRRLPEDWRGTFDAAVSIEMIEAVGPKNLRDYFAAAHSALKPGGKFLVQAIIGHGTPDLWLSTYIFPNGVLPSASQLYSSTRRLFTAARWESFGADYDRTLMTWHEKFKKAWPQIRALKSEDGNTKYDERFYRMWRYYLLQCAGIFRSGYIDVAQILFTKVS